MGVPTPHFDCHRHHRDRAQQQLVYRSMPWRSGLRHIALVSFRPRRQPIRWARQVSHQHFERRLRSTSPLATTKSSSWTTRSLQCLQAWDSTIPAQRRSVAAHLANQWLLVDHPNKNQSSRLVTLLLQKLALEQGDDVSKSPRWQTELHVLLQKTLTTLSSEAAAPSLALRLLGTFRELERAVPHSVYTALLVRLPRSSIQMEAAEHQQVQSWVMADLFGNDDEPRSTEATAALLVARNAYLHYLVTSAHRNNVGGMTSDSTKVSETIASLIDRMKPSTAVDGHSYSSLLRAYIQENQVDQACAVLRSETIARSNASCINVCLDALADRGQTTKTDQLFRDMFFMGSSTQSPTPDAYSYLAVIRAWQHNPRRATEWLEHMHQHLPSNLYCCTAVLEAWARVPNQGETVSTLLDSLMQNHGFVPSTTTLTTVIKAWGNSAEQSIDAADRATEVFGRIVDPDGPAYTALLQAWAKSAPYREDAVDKVLRVWEAMLATTPTTPPTVAAFNSVLRALAQTRQSSTAESFLHSAANYAITPNATSYSLVMSSFRGQDDVDAAIHRLWDAHCTYATQAEQPTLIRAAIRYHSSAETAERFVWGLAVADRLSVDVCNALLQRWSRSPNPVAVQRSEDILQCMVQQGMAPTRETYAYLVHTWKTSGRQVAESRLQELQTLQSMLQ